MSPKIKWGLVFAASVVLFFYLDGPKETHKLVDPVGYWTKQRDTAQEQIHFYQDQLRWCLLEFERLRQTNGILMGQSRLTGKTPEEARKDFQDDVKATQETCKAMRELLAMEKQELDSATQELLQYQFKGPIKVIK